MPIKQVFQSDPGVYRTGLAYGLVDPWAGTVDQDRIYDEYIWDSFIAGITVVENLESPTDYEIVLFVLNHERSSGVGAGANIVAMRWSGLTGEFLGHDDRQNRLGLKGVTTGANGTTWATWAWLSGGGEVLKLDPNTFLFNVIHPVGYYSGSSGLVDVPCIDEGEDLALLLNNSAHHVYGEVAVHRESTGEFLYKFWVNGKPDAIFMTDDRRAYTVADDGTLTLFNYVTGQILGVLHAGLTDNIRRWAWDRVAKRILCFERTPDIMPEGHCTCRITGYYPIPVAHDMTDPIPLQAPAQDRRVEWVTKVYGAAGEGVPGVAVNYALDTPTGATVSPASHTTDLNGNSRTYVTSSLAGDNTLNATAEV